MDLNLVYKEIRRYLPSFLTLFRIMKQQRMMTEQDVVDTLKFGKELLHLKDQFELLVEEINSFECKKNSLRAVLSALQNQISAALKNEPEKQLVIYDLLYNNNNDFYPSYNNDDSISYTTGKIMSSSTANPENYLQSFVHRKVFQIAEKFYDMLLKVAVNDTIYPLESISTDQFR